MQVPRGQNPLCRRVGQTGFEQNDQRENMRRWPTLPWFHPPYCKRGRRSVVTVPAKLGETRVVDIARGPNGHGAGGQHADRVSSSSSCRRAVRPSRGIEAGLVCAGAGRTARRRGGLAGAASRTLAPGRRGRRLEDGAFVAFAAALLGHHGAGVEHRTAG